MKTESRCSENKNIPCKWSCPLSYKSFSEDADFYFLGIRKEAAKRNPEVFIRKIDKHYPMLKRAWFYKLFVSEQGFYAVVDYYLFGTMTEIACKELRSVKKNYILLQKKAFMENPSFRIGCELAQVHPRVQEVTLWWRREGAAYKAWRKYLKEER